MFSIVLTKTIWQSLFMNNGTKKATHLTPEERAKLRELADNVRMSEILTVLASIVRYDMPNAESVEEITSLIFSASRLLREEES